MWPLRCYAVYRCLTQNSIIKICFRNFARCTGNRKLLPRSDSRKKAPTRLTRLYVLISVRLSQSLCSLFVRCQVCLELYHSSSSGGLRASEQNEAKDIQCLGSHKIS